MTEFYIAVYDEDNTYYSDGPFADEQRALKDLTSWAEQWYEEYGERMGPDMNRKAAYSLSLMRKGETDPIMASHGEDTVLIYSFGGMDLEVYKSAV